MDSVSERSGGSGGQVNPGASAAPAAGGAGTVPAHVAIIMDGNGRWAKSRGLPRSLGHKAGAESVRRTVRAAGELGIKFLTLYSFSSENWKRSPLEVEDLMGLLRHYLRNEIAELHRNKVRLRVIGERSRLNRDIQTLIADGEAATANNPGLTLVLALSYGARNEILDAVRTLAAQAAAGALDPARIDEDRFSAALSTHFMPDPDLIIRTSGEQRLSNFLLWQAAYAEFVFVDQHWPDFGRAELEGALAVFQARERRYGGRAG